MALLNSVMAIWNTELLKPHAVTVHLCRDLLNFVKLNFSQCTLFLKIRSMFLTSLWIITSSCLTQYLYCNSCNSQYVTIWRRLGSFRLHRKLPSISVRFIKKKNFKKIIKLVISSRQGQYGSCSVLKDPPTISSYIGPPQIYGFIRHMDLYFQTFWIWHSVCVPSSVVHILIPSVCCSGERIAIPLLYGQV